MQAKDNQTIRTFKGGGRGVKRVSAVGLGVVLALAGSVLIPAKGVAALDARVDACTDVSLCSDLTVKKGRKSTSSPTPDTRRYLSACGPMFLRNGVYYQDHCYSDGTRITIKYSPDDIVRVTPKPTVKDISASARGLLSPPPPRIHTSPRAVTGLLVHTPTWLWLSPAYWRTYTQTVSLLGVTVTMNATPTHVTWKMGNGDRITCIGPGNPWLGGSGEVGSTCSYTYRHSSAQRPGGRYRITATVTFVGTFVTTGLVNLAGPLGIITRSSSIWAKVAEIQGLVVT